MELTLDAEARMREIADSSESKRRQAPQSATVENVLVCEVSHRKRFALTQEQTEGPVEAQRRAVREPGKSKDAE